MQDKQITGRISSPGPQTDDERDRLRDIREKVSAEFPPRDPPRLAPAVNGIGAKIRAARESQGLNWYSLAEKAGIPNVGTIRDIEVGRDVTLADIEAVVAALGLKLELVES